MEPVLDQRAGRALRWRALLEVRSGQARIRLVVGRGPSLAIEGSGRWKRRGGGCEGQSEESLRPDGRGKHALSSSVVDVWRRKVRTDPVHPPFFQPLPHQIPSHRPQREPQLAHVGVVSLCRFDVPPSFVDARERRFVRREEEVARPVYEGYDRTDGFE